LEGMPIMGLWISIAKKLRVDSGNDGTEMEKSINSEVTPPTPHTLKRLAGRGVRKKCLQDLDCRGVRGQNLHNKGVRAVLGSFAGTAFASSMMGWIGIVRKVRCHRVGVENETSSPEAGGDPFDQLAGIDNRGLTPSRGKVALVAGDQIVCAGGLRTFKEPIVGRVVSDH